MWRDWAEVSRGHSGFERTQGPNIATTWRSRANLEKPLNPTGRGLFGGQRVTSHEISAMNRPLRTRMVGGVGGRELKTLAYPIRPRLPGLRFNAAEKILV